MASIRSLTANLTVANDPADRGWQKPRPETAGSLEPPDHSGLRLRSPLLSHAIERRILPQLLRLHPQRRKTIAIATVTETLAVAAYAASCDQASLSFALERMLASGATPEAVCLGVLAPAARHLGELWEEDELDFVQVTIGVQRLQHALHMLIPGHAEGRPTRSRTAPAQRRILVIPVPGSEHSFGVSMVARFFRNAGWDVHSGLSPNLDDVACLMRTTYFDIVGISASCDLHIEPLSRTLRTIRQHSCNPEIGTMVGGPLFAAHPELAVQLGADSTAQDAAQAPLQAELLLRERQDAHKASAVSGGASLRIVTPEERGGSDRRDTFHDGRNDARRPRSSIDSSNYFGSC